MLRFVWTAGRAPACAALALALTGGCTPPPSDTAREPLVVQAEPRSPPPASPARTPPPDAPPPTPTPQATPSLPAFGEAGLTQLDADTRGLLVAGDADAPIEVEIHYVQSNETRHDLYFPYIEGVGGSYVGVGSDQNYTLMAKARAEYAFLMDIDERVVDLHRMYEIFIPQSPTAAELVERWHEDREQDGLEELTAAFSDLDAAEQRRILLAYRISRETVYRHLLRVIARTVDGEPASWLSDPALYDHVRALYQAQRVRIMPGDLTGSTTLQTVGTAVTALASTVSVFYMSNAEEYFKYTSGFAANVAALPHRPEGVVLRTIYSKRWEHADLWAYQVQPIADLHQRLSDAKNRSRNPMLRYAEREGDLVREDGRGFSRVGIDAAPSGS